jgi:nitrogen fixation protein NifU and related proteins
MFNETILEHFRNPRNTGEIADATVVVEVVNPVCGDVLRLSVRMEAGRVAEARFKTQGCVAAIAASSVLTDMLTGKSANDFRSITPQKISEALGTLPPATLHAAQLCGDALSALSLKLG